MTALPEKYSDTGHVKHQFFAITRTSSVCGVSLAWYSNGKWKFDEKGLKERRMCKTCIRITSAV